MRVEPKGGFNFRSFLKRGTFTVKVLLGLEAVGLVGSYFLWRKMNTDQDFRYKVYQASPYSLEYYYKVGEKLGGSSYRHVDAEAWGIKAS